MLEHNGLEPTPLDPESSALTIEDRWKTRQATSGIEISLTDPAHCLNALSIIPADQATSFSIPAFSWLGAVQKTASKKIINKFRLSSKLTEHLEKVIVSHSNV